MKTAGQVVGRSDTTKRTVHAFLSDGSTGQMTDLGTLGGSDSAAIGINASGQVVGNSWTKTNQYHAFRYTVVAGAGKMTDLGTLGGNESVAAGINSAGQVVGGSTTANGQRHAFLSNDGTGAGQMIDLGTLSGVFSVATAINDAGQVVGDSTTAGNVQHAFLSTGRAGAGQMIDLGTLGNDSHATGINAAGQVVGYSRTSEFAPYVPFFYDEGTMFDVSKLVTGFTDIRQKIFLNDAGQLAGNGTINGQSHAFLLSYEADVNVPEPASIALLGMGLLGLAAARRKRSR